MKKYLADILTLTRFVLVAVMVFLTIYGNVPESIDCAFVAFILAELTDAFDGVCATKWPFPPNRVPKYRKYAAKYDIIADSLTALVGMIFFTLRVNFVVGLSATVIYGVASGIIEYIVYGKLLAGHPDNCTPNSLARRNFPLAKKIILTRRAIYLSLLAFFGVWLLYVTTWSLWVKISITILAIPVVIFFWFFLSQRRHNISRNAVKLEQQLEKSQKVSYDKNIERKKNGKID